MPTYRQVLLAGCALLIGACASGPKPQTSQARNDDPNGSPVASTDITPQAQTMYEQAAAAMAADDGLEAQLRFQEFLLQYPGFPGAHVNLAIIFANNGDDNAAEGSITDALILDPQHPAALNQLGMLLRRQGKFPEAESAYLKAVTANPDYALAHYNLGVLNELYLQKLDVALEHYERYQELTEEDKQVGKWIADIKRRISNAQRTANVTESGA